MTRRTLTFTSLERGVELPTELFRFAVPPGSTLSMPPGGGGEVYRIGVGGVTAPRLIRKVEPDFSSEARSAGVDGTVVLYVVVDEQGAPRDLKVVRSLGFGLDEKAIEAVTQWLFQPGLKDGKPVRVAAQINVNFVLKYK